MILWGFGVLVIFTCFVFLLFIAGVVILYYIKILSIYLYLNLFLYFFLFFTMFALFSLFFIWLAALVLFSVLCFSQFYFYLVDIIFAFLCSLNHSPVLCFLWTVLILCVCMCLCVCTPLFFYLSDFALTICLGYIFF